MATLIVLGLGGNLKAVLTMFVIDAMTMTAGFMLGAYKRSKK